MEKSSLFNYFQTIDQISSKKESNNAKPKFTPGSPLKDESFTQTTTTFITQYQSNRSSPLQLRDNYKSLNNSQIFGNSRNMSRPLTKWKPNTSQNSQIQGLHSEKDLSVDNRMKDKIFVKQTAPSKIISDFQQIIKPNFNKTFNTFKVSHVDQPSTSASSSAQNLKSYFQFSSQVNSRNDSPNKSQDLQNTESPQFDKKSIELRQDSQKLIRFDDSKKEQPQIDSPKRNQVDYQNAYSTPMGLPGSFSSLPNLNNSQNTKKITQTSFLKRANIGMMKKNNFASEIIRFRQLDTNQKRERYFETLEESIIVKIPDFNKRFTQFLEYEARRNYKTDPEKATTVFLELIQIILASFLILEPLLISCEKHSKDWVQLDRLLNLVVQEASRTKIGVYQVVVLQFYGKICYYYRDFPKSINLMQTCQNYSQYYNIIEPQLTCYKFLGKYMKLYRINQFGF